MVELLGYEKIIIVIGGRIIKLTTQCAMKRKLASFSGSFETT